MKIIKKLAVSLCVLTLFLSFSVLTALASELPENAQGYYEITLHAGNKGAIDGVPGGSYTIRADYGETVIFNLSRISVTDEKYYIKGVRLSGRDNNEAAPAFTVKGDADYVVAYGIKGNMVSYTVKYQDVDGRELAPDSTFYGNIGDKPVVAYQYIEGYVPQALALTKTLSANEAENVFIFVYTPGEPGTITIVGEDTTTVVTVVVPGTAGGTAAGTGQAGAGAQGGEGAGGEEAGDQEAGGIGEEAGGSPEELVDLDEIETPAADIDLNKDSAKAVPLAAFVCLGIAALAALIVMIVLVRKRMKKQ